MFFATFHIQEVRICGHLRNDSRRLIFLPYVVDEMADNTCHFGVNSFFADNGLSDVQSWLYFPADPLQMVAIVKQVFFERGLRFIFSTRSKVPYILKEDGRTKFFDDDYKFVPGKDETIVEGTAGYVVSFGEMLYRSWDAVLRCRQDGLDVGLINKSTLNIVDEQVRKSVHLGTIVFSDRASRRLERLVRPPLYSLSSR